MAGSGMQGGFPGMQPPPKEEGVTYLCVTDVQITDRKIGKPLGQPSVLTSFTLIAAPNAPRPL